MWTLEWRLKSPACIKIIAVNDNKHRVILIQDLLLLVRNESGQCSQEYFFTSSPLWRRRWIFICDFWRKALPHNSHKWHLWSAWEAIWDCKMLSWLNRLLHVTHLILKTITRKWIIYILEYGRIKKRAHTGKAFLLYVSSCGLEEFSFPGISHYIPNRSMFYPQYEI